jgi:pyruvate dehydrogenase (quinone)
MSLTVAELLAETLAEIGVRQIFGIVGDALNPFTDAIRREPGLEWIGVRTRRALRWRRRGRASSPGGSASAAA